MVSKVPLLVAALAAVQVVPGALVHTASRLEAEDVRPTVLSALSPPTLGPDVGRRNLGRYGHDLATGPTPSPEPVGWTSSFEDESFSEWTTWGRGEEPQAQLYGGQSVVSPTASSVRNLHGRKVAHFQVSKPMSDIVVYTEPSGVVKRRVHSKVMKEWRLSGYPKTDDLDRQMDLLPRGSPGGTYRASFFFPESYAKGVGEPWSLWTNIFQFKEAWTQDGQNRQDPQWWVNVSRAGSWSYDPEGAPGYRTRAPNRPVLHVNRPRDEGEHDGYQPKLRVVPLGRWFELRAEVFPGDRIEWYLDGVRFDTSLDSEHPVGLSKGDSASSPAHSEGWLFGIGHYDGIGELWADGVSFTPH